MNRSYRVDLEKETFIFSAAHFITFNKNVCEPVHGHNYRVKCIVQGELDENHYVIDFIALRDKIKELTSLWDHHVLLATLHPQISVKEIETDGRKEVEVRFEDPQAASKRWIFPYEDCALVPIENTTAELLAKYLADQIVEFLKATFEQLPDVIEVWVDENEGQWGICRFELND